jgi:uncharacterized protein YciW
MVDTRHTSALRLGIASPRYPAILRAAMQILVSIDERLLALLDRQATKEGLSRSAYIARLADRELNARQGPGRAAQVHRAMDSLDRLFARHGNREESTQLIRSERDAH